MKRTVLIVTAVMVAPVVAHGQSYMAKGLAHLPAKVCEVVAIDIQAWSNPKSLCSMLPKPTGGLTRGGLPTISMAESFQAMGEAAQSVILASKAGEKFLGFVWGTLEYDTAMQPVGCYQVLTGTFTREEGLSYVGACLADVSSGQLRTITNTKVYAAVPANNVILLTTEVPWLTEAPRLAATRTGLLSPRTSFMTLMTSLNGHLPDAFYYCDDTAPLGKAIGTDPDVTALLEPLAGFKQAALLVFPGDVPSIELHVAFADTSGPELLKNRISTLVSEGSAELKRIPVVESDPQDKAVHESATEVLANIKSSTFGNTGIVRWNVTDRSVFTILGPAIMEGYLEGVEEAEKTAGSSAKTE